MHIIWTCLPARPGTPEAIAGTRSSAGCRPRPGPTLIPSPQNGLHSRAQTRRLRQFPALRVRSGDRWQPCRGGPHLSDSNQRKEDNPVAHLELNLAATAGDMPEIALALMRAIVAAADGDQDEMTVLLIHGGPKAVIAPYGDERRPGAAAEIGFGQTAPPEARLVLRDTSGGGIRTLGWLA
jgi:hypothetical protein